jgi:uncharacterized protein YbjT (DUF2867 family)
VARTRDSYVSREEGSISSEDHCLWRHGHGGQGILRECLLDPEVERVQSIGRKQTGIQHPKLHETLRPDLSHYAEFEPDFAGFDACFFSLGVSSAGMEEEGYARVTYDVTMTAAETLCRLNPQMKFIYVSGAGTDSSERGRSMWARVKGKTENALLRLPFAAAYMFRPGLIQPLHGERPRATFYKFFYPIAQPLLPWLRRTFPNQVLTTEEIGQAMLMVVRRDYPKRILETGDIRAILTAAASSEAAKSE